MGLLILILLILLLVALGGGHVGLRVFLVR